MKNIFKYCAAALILVSFIVGGCDNSQVVEDPITPGGYGYATATFTTDFTGNEVSEGDTIKYMIKLDKALDRALTFTLKLEDGTADENDFSWSPVTINPFTKEAEFDVVVVADGVPELTETAKFEIGVFGLGDRYLLSPKTVNPVLNLNIINTSYDSGGLAVAVYWPDTDDDWDAYIIDEAGLGDPNGWGYDFVGYEGATSADPEVMLFLEDYYGYWTAPDGVYYVDVDPYDVSSALTDFTISVGYPNGDVEFFKFTFDMAKADAGDYPMTWGYSTLKIVKTGLNYTVSLLPAYTTGTKSFHTGTIKSKEFFYSAKNAKRLF
ncbi:MAG: hypothetical protein GXO80_06270 [Chlorobi bacterium]|nr:hypothetical protein [Chlorobiota bacterium]